MHTIFINNLIQLSSMCFEQPSVHPQEDLYMQFFGIFLCTLISSLVNPDIIQIQ
jgi:hypothetical protein